jgi:ketosteroid isomerase-like protein
MVAGGRALVEQFYHRFNSGDLDQAVELFAPDVVTVEPFLGRAREPGHMAGLRRGVPTGLPGRPAADAVLG